MLTPGEIDRLRDSWCIQLLEATSSTAALARAHLEDREHRPVYDVAPDPFFGRGGTIQPRDQIRTCPRCGGWFASRSSRARCCSAACLESMYRRRVKARLEAVA